MKINDEVTQADHVAGIISGTGKNSLRASAYAVSYRVPMNLLAAVDAMAAESKKSRNAMLNLLVEVGIDEVREKLDQDVAERLMVQEAKAFSLLAGETSETIEE